MNCDEIKNILLHESASDIEKKLTKEFLQHVSECRECKKLHSSVIVIEQSSDSLASETYELDFDKIANKVMLQIEDQSNESRLTGAIDIASLLFKPMIRIGYALLLFFIMLWYFSLEYNDHLKIVNLEVRLNMKHYEPTVPLKLESLSYASLSKSVTKIIEALQPSEVHYSDFFLRAEHIELIGMLIQTESERNPGFKNLLNNSDVNLNDGIDNVEIQKLLENRDQIYKALGLNKGG